MSANDSNTEPVGGAGERKEEKWPTREQNRPSSQSTTPSDEFVETSLSLARELEDFRDAGGDSLKLVGALVNFVHAICAQRDNVKYELEIERIKRACQQSKTP